MADYSFLAIDKPLDLKDYLLYVERTINTVYHDDDIIPSDRPAATALHLAGFAYTQGSMIAFALHNDWLQMSLRERIDEMIAFTYDRWTTTVDYCRHMVELRIHPAYILQYLCRICDQLISEGDERYTVLRTALIDKVTELYKGADETVQQYLELTDRVPADEKGELEVSSEKSNLIEEYCQLMTELGTFYADWSKYNNPDDRARYDRLMEIYRELTS